MAPLVPGGGEGCRGEQALGRSRPFREPVAAVRSEWALAERQAGEAAFEPRSSRVEARYLVAGASSRPSAAPCFGGRFRGPAPTGQDLADVRSVAPAGIKSDDADSDQDRMSDDRGREADGHRGNPGSAGFVGPASQRPFRRAHHFAGARERSGWEFFFTLHKQAFLVWLPLEQIVAPLLQVARCSGPAAGDAGGPRPPPLSDGALVNSAGRRASGAG